MFDPHELKLERELILAVTSPLQLCMYFTFIRLAYKKDIVVELCMHAFGTREEPHWRCCGS